MATTILWPTPMSSRKTSNYRLNRALNTLSRWYHRYHQRRKLLDLEDRMLKDIGISRVEALAEAKKPFWKE